MDPDNEKRLIALLSNRFNGWWNNQKIIAPEFRRRDFRYLIKKLDEEKVLTIIGPRQSGKTTVVKQMIIELIEVRNVPPRRVLYIQLDDVELRLLCDNNALIDVLDVYQKYILNEDINRVQQPIYIFIDEVQRIENWAEHVKALYDANKKIHIIATGSASFMISQKSKETLPGRQELYSMFPLKFIDIISIHSFFHSNENLMAQEQCKALDSLSYELRDSFEQALYSKSFSTFFEACKKVHAEYAPLDQELKNSVSRYLSRGGYPEVAITDDTATCQKLLRSYANDIIVKDLMPWFKIRDFGTAEMLLYILASISGEQMNVKSVLKRIQAKKESTVRKYIYYFKMLQILGEVQVYSGSKMGSSKYPKVYFYDVGLRNAILGLLDSPFQDTEKGHLAETVAHDHLIRLGFKLNQSVPARISCYKHQSCGKIKEIDFILELPRFGIKLPIEIKFRKNITDFEALQGFLKETKQSLGLIITEDSLDLKDGILLMPLWMFLLLC